MPHLKLQMNQKLVAAHLVGIQPQELAKSQQAIQQMDHQAQAGRSHAGQNMVANPNANMNAAAPPTDEALSHQVLEEILFQINELENARVQSLKEMQQLAVKLAVAAAKKVTYAEIEENDSRIVSLIQKGIESMGTTYPVAISINSTDLERIQSNPVIKRLSEDGRFEFHGDNSVPLGECQLKSSSLDLSTSVAQQFHEIENSILESLSHAEVERRDSGKFDSVQRVPSRRQA